MHSLGYYNFIYIIFIVFVILGIGAFVYSVNKCGFVKTVLLGNGSVYAAMSGMCDNK